MIPDEAMGRAVVLSTVVRLEKVRSRDWAAVFLSRMRMMSSRYIRSNKARIQLRR